MRGGVTLIAEVVRAGFSHGYRYDELADGAIREQLFLGDDLLASWDDSMPERLRRTGCPSDRRLLEAIGSTMREYL